ncbi:MAG: hypothetical protein OZ921_00665 [Sorangiineae bacterium]|nr:hypothetical protein [Polyangiaceae bacterium]MEB2320995.1 hypothetical protein [Sorangiineae bacterium]
MLTFDSFLERAEVVAHDLEERAPQRPFASPGLEEQPLLPPLHPI